MISPEDVEKLMEKLDKLGEGDVLFLASPGSAIFARGWARARRDRVP